MTTSENIAKLIREKKGRIPNIHIGMLLKERRLELGLTLREATKGICCISYLSKLEHGILEPKADIMEEMLKRLKVPANMVKTTEQYNKLIHKAIMALKDNNQEIIDEVHKTIVDGENIYFADLIKACYKLFNDDLDGTHFELSKVLDMRSYLDSDELVAFILVNGLFYYRKGDYIESLSNYALLEDFFINDIHFDVLRLRGIIDNKYLLGQYVGLHDYIDEYKQKCTKIGDFKEIMRVQKMYSLSLAHLKEEYESRLVLNQLRNSLLPEEALLWEKELAIANYQVKESLEYDLTPLEKMWAFDCLNNKLKMRELIKEYVPKDLDTRETIFYESMVIKYSDTRENYYQYLKKTAFAYAIKTGIYTDIMYYGEKLVRELQQSCKYKEAVFIYAQISRNHSLCWEK